jgi:hypothetical protein
MEIIINDKRIIQTLQEEFNSEYPFLKLEFFSKPHKSGRGTAIKYMKGHLKTIGECRTVRKNGKIIVTPQMTVSDLEQSFSDPFGLGVQVFRKSGKIWLETTMTDGWTLEEQNHQGQMLSDGRR